MIHIMDESIHPIRTASPLGRRTGTLRITTRKLINKIPTVKVGIRVSLVGTNVL